MPIHVASLTTGLTTFSITHARSENNHYCCQISGLSVTFLQVAVERELSDHEKKLAERISALEATVDRKGKKK